MSPRRAPKYVLGGSLHRAPSGYLATIQTARTMHPAPLVMAELWPTLRGKRHPAVWDGVEPKGATVILWTPTPTTIRCGECGKSLGKYRAYEALGEHGIVNETPIRYHPPGRHTSESLRHLPNDRHQPIAPIYWRTGEDGFRAAKTFAHFRCTICRIEFEENMRRLGRKLFKEIPDTYRLTNVVRREAQ